MKSRNLIILAAIVVLLGAYILLFERHRPTTDEARRDADKVFPGLETDEVTGVVVVGPEGSVRLEKVGDDWQLREPIAYPADSATVSSTLSSLAGLDADRRLAAEEVDAAEYGLDIPQAEVTLTLEESSDRIRVLLVQQKTGVQVREMIKSLGQTAEIVSLVAPETPPASPAGQPTNE